MSRTFVEILLFVPVALATGFMLFIAGVIQGIMNDMDEAAFKSFLTVLVKHALRSPYGITVSSITFVGMIPYWIFYGFGNRWFTAGLVLWVVTSFVSKYTTIPIYTRVTGLDIPGFKKVTALESSDAAELRAERRKLQKVNILRAGLSFATVVLMVIGLL